MRPGEDTSAMPRDSHLCDPLVTPMPNHALCARVDGARAEDTLIEVAVIQAAAVLLAYGVLHGVKPLQCDNETAEHMDRRGLSNTAGAAYVVQTGYTRGIVTCILRPSYGQGSWLDGHRLPNSGAHVTRIRKLCNVFRATMLNNVWTRYD